MRGDLKSRKRELGRLRMVRFRVKKKEALKRASRMEKFIRDAGIVSSVSRGNQYDEGHVKDMLMKGNFIS